MEPIGRIVPRPFAVVVGMIAAATVPVIAGASGCGGAAATQTSSPGGEGPAPPAERPAMDVNDPSLAVTLALPEGDGDGLRVRIEASGSPVALERWTAATLAEGHGSEIRAEDARGSLGVEVEQGEDGLALRFDREVVPPVTVAYLLSDPPRFEPALGVGVRDAHLVGTVLLLPDGWGPGAVTVTMGEATVVATSVGLGDVRKR